MAEKESDILDAVKELTTQITVLVKSVDKLREEWDKWRKAGKF